MSPSAQIGKVSNSPGRHTRLPLMFISPIDPISSHPGPISEEQEMTVWVTLANIGAIFSGFWAVTLRIGA